MLEAYKNFWLGYLDFYGRTKRSDYWWVVLINGKSNSINSSSLGDVCLSYKRFKITPI